MQACKVITQTLTYIADGLSLFVSIDDVGLLVHLHYSVGGSQYIDHAWGKAKTTPPPRYRLGVSIGAGIFNWLSELFKNLKLDFSV
jgi:hypothetical protein